MLEKLIFLLCLIAGLLSSLLKAQTIEVEYSGGKEASHKASIVAYTSLIVANKVNPDSVIGLDLTSQGFQDFPREILKFRNLQYLNIDSYNWGQVLDSLTDLQRELYYQLKEQACDRCGVMKFYKGSTIKTIPRRLKKLSKLEYVSFGEGVRISNKRKFKKIYKYLPDATIYPTKWDWEEG